MVVAVKAWKSVDGSLHASIEDAEAADVQAYRRQIWKRVEEEINENFGRMDVCDAAEIVEFLMGKYDISEIGD